MNTVKQIALIGLLCSSSGCWLWQPSGQAPQVVSISENPVPGTVRGAWEEPMYDQIEIPAQLDPNGITYRPRHTSIVEIPTGRVLEVQFPDDRVQTLPNTETQQ